jgi:hypothetical protein
MLSDCISSAHACLHVSYRTHAAKWPRRCLPRPARLLSPLSRRPPSHRAFACPRCHLLASSSAKQSFVVAPLVCSQPGKGKSNQQRKQASHTRRTNTPGKEDPAQKSASYRVRRLKHCPSRPSSTAPIPRHPFAQAPHMKHPSQPWRRASRPRPTACPSRPRPSAVLDAGPSSCAAHGTPRAAATSSATDATSISLPVGRVTRTASASAAPAAPRPLPWAAAAGAHSSASLGPTPASLADAGCSAAD